MIQQVQRGVNYIRIPEIEVEKTSVEVAKEAPEDQNSFIKVLNAGKMFKEAGLTPIYLTDMSFTNIFVVVEEYIDGSVTLH